MALALTALWGLTAFAAFAPTTWLERSHRTGSPVFWALTQPTPFMYTGEHVWTYAPEGDPPPELAEACAKVRTMKRNHVPVGVLTSYANRFTLANCAPASVVTVSSRWRSHRARSTWRIRRIGDVVQVEPLP